MECSSPSRVETILETKFFFLFVGLSQPELALNEARFTFFFFFVLNYFTIFLEFSSLGLAKMVPEMEIFYLFSACPVPFCQKMKPEWRFLIFWIFFLFLFFGMLHPPRSGRKGTRIKIFLIYFSAWDGPVWLGMKPEWHFLICWIFLVFFWECSNPGRVEIALRKKIFLSLFQSIPAKFSQKWSQNDIFLLFFIGTLQPWSGRNGTWNEKFFISFFIGLGSV